MKELLTAEEQRRASLEARGTSVITVSGTLVTLLLALAGFATKRANLHLSTSARVLVIAAVIAFAVSALLAILAYSPQRERIAVPEGVAETIRADWDEGADFARKRVTATRLEALGALQRANDRRAAALLGAAAAQVAALALLAGSVAQLL